MKYLLIFLITLPLHAQVKVHLADPDYDPKVFDKSVKISTQEVKSPRLPQKEKRDQLFSSYQELKKLDELDQDLLFLALKNKDVKILKKQFPQISEEILKELKSQYVH